MLSDQKLNESQLFQNVILLIYISKRSICEMLDERELRLRRDEANGVIKTN